MKKKVKKNWGGAKFFGSASVSRVGRETGDKIFFSGLNSKNEEVLDVFLVDRLMQDFLYFVG